MRTDPIAIVLLAACAACVTADDAKPTAAPLYANDLEKIEPGEAPEEFMVLNGDFLVKQADGNRLLELPGGPLDTMGMLFGKAAKDGICASARIRGEARGRLMPAFGVGLNGAGGWRLQVAPMRKSLELLKADAVKTSVPYAWTSGTWTRFRLQSRKTGEATWTIEGKAWADGAKEPPAWMIAFEWKKPPAAGRPSVWGIPFSDLPIQFDDLRVTPARKP